MPESNSVPTLVESLAALVLADLERDMPSVELARATERRMRETGESREVANLAVIKARFPNVAPEPEIS